MIFLIGLIVFLLFISLAYAYGESSYERSSTNNYRSMIDYHSMIHGYSDERYRYLHTQNYHLINHWTSMLIGMFHMGR